MKSRRSSPFQTCKCNGDSNEVSLRVPDVVRPYEIFVRWACIITFSVESKNRTISHPLLEDMKSHSFAHAHHVKQVGGVWSGLLHAASCGCMLHVACRIVARCTLRFNRLIARMHHACLLCSVKQSLQYCHKENIRRSSVHLACLSCVVNPSLQDCYKENV